jgi:hypothetical protein
MEMLYERCAGLDVHKKNVKGCLITPGPRHQPTKEIRTYLTTTHGLLQMRDWLHDQGCSHLAMESTGVYTPPQCCQKDTGVGICSRDPAYLPSHAPARAASRIGSWLRIVPRRQSSAGFRSVSCPRRPIIAASTWRSRSCLSHIASNTTSSRQRMLFWFLCHEDSSLLHSRFPWPLA